MTRIKDIVDTATAPASDDYVALDGVTNGSRKILAAVAQSGFIGRAEAVGGETSLTVSSIPALFDDLLILVSCRTSAGVDPLIRVNGDSGSNYSSSRHFGGTSHGSSGPTPSTGFTQLFGSQTAANLFASGEMTIYDYARTDRYKEMTGAARQAGFIMNGAGVWNSVAAINSVTFFLPSATFQAGSTLRVYGR